MKYLKTYEKHTDKIQGDIDSTINYFYNNYKKLGNLYLDWEFNIDKMSGTFELYNKNRFDGLIYATPFWEYKMEIPITIYFDSDNTERFFTHELDKVPSNEKERKEFFDWYFNKFIIKYINISEIEEKMEKLLNVLIKNVGSNDKVDINIKIGNDLINSIYFLDDVFFFKIDNSDIFIYDYEPLDKLYDALVEKYPDIIEGNEFGFFGLKENKLNEQVEKNELFLSPNEFAEEHISIDELSQEEFICSERIENEEFYRIYRLNKHWPSHMAGKFILVWVYRTDELDPEIVNYLEEKDRNLNYEIYTKALKNLIKKMQSYDFQKKYLTKYPERVNELKPFGLDKKIKEEFADIIEGNEFGFFGLKENKLNEMHGEEYRNYINVRDTMKYLWNNYKRYTYYNDWKFQIGMDQLLGWYSDELIVYITPFLDNECSMRISLYFSDDEMQYWDEKIEKIPETSKEISKFFDWYFYEYSPNILKMVDKSVESEIFLKTLINAIGVDDKLELNIDINGDNIEYVRHSKRFDDLYIKIERYENSDTDTNEIEFYAYDLYKIVKLYDILLKKYPDIDEGSKFGFFGLK